MLPVSILESLKSGNSGTRLQFQQLRRMRQEDPNFKAGLMT